MNNNFNELDDLHELINLYYKLPFISKKLYFYSESNKIHKYLSTYFLNLANKQNINELNLLINWIISSRYYIIDNPNKELCFRLINKNYSLFAQIALSRNLFSTDLPTNSLILELHYLISVKKGSHIGANFIGNLIKLQQAMDIPLILYCSNSLIDYYKKFGFNVITKNIKNEYLLVYGLPQ